MLSPELVRAVRALRASGVSQERTAAKLGISRKTVERIDRRESRFSSLPADPVEPDADPAWPGKPARCKGCGGLITTPDCRACADRAMPRATPADADPTEAVGLELKRAERRRYPKARRHALTRQGIDPRAADRVFEEHAEQIAEAFVDRDEQIDAAAVDALFADLAGE